MVLSPSLCLLEDEGIIRPGITEEEQKVAWRRWEVRAHPDKGGDTGHYTKVKALKTHLDTLGMRQVRLYFNGKEMLEDSLAEHDVPENMITKQTAAYADACWEKHRRMRFFTNSLKSFLEKKKWPREDIKLLLRNLKDVQDVRSKRPARSATPQRAQSRIGWVDPTRKTSNCRKCSSTAITTGVRCRLPASCRIGCEVKCWRHSTTHVPRQSCRD